MWQGTPLKFLNSDILESTKIAITKAPHLLVDSSPDYVGAGATFLGAFAAGCLTAYVAWYAINVSRKQMLRQQQIINSQKFIDEIRVKISSFLADIEKLSLMLQKDSFGHQLTISNINHASRGELNDVAHRIDLSYYHILLMIDGKPQFEEMISLIEAIKNKIGDSVRNVQYSDIEPISMKLIKATIKCVDFEWDTITKDTN